MAQSNMQTTHPIALGALLNETIFGIPDAAEVAASDLPVRTEAETPRFVFYGDNNRRYLFLTHDQHHEWMSEAAMDAFSKTLAALKLSSADIALLNLFKCEQACSKEQLVSFFQPKVVVLLGVPASLLEVDCPEGSFTPDGTERTILRAASFDEMLVNSDKKRQFWVAAKTLLV